jgi:cyclopropane-fatty-acyl-phospholipid synthase
VLAGDVQGGHGDGDGKIDVAGYAARTMIYKFKSKVTGDLIMLEANGQAVLKIIGKADAETLTKGILLPEDMLAAILALENAIALEESAHAEALKKAQATGHEAPNKPNAVSLRQRCVPFIQMLQRCHKAGKEVVWGV